MLIHHNNTSVFMHKIIVPTLLASVALAVILTIHVSDIQAQYVPGEPTTPQPIILQDREIYMHPDTKERA
jgi:hypothetical protein